MRFSTIFPMFPRSWRLSSLDFATSLRGEHLTRVRVAGYIKGAREMLWPYIEQWSEWWLIRKRGISRLSIWFWV